MTFLSFLPSLNNGFTNWDDNRYVTENPDLCRTDGKGLVKIVTATYAGNYHPLTMLVYLAEYRTFRLNPEGYHWVSLLLHLMNALLVCACLRALSGSSAAALVGGLLFAVHPLRVESVAWIAEQKDVLCGLFYFLSILLYLRYSASRRSMPLYLCFLTFAAALLAKPMAVSLPLTLFAIDYLQFRRFTPKCLAEKAPFVTVAALFCIVALHAQSSGGALNDHAALPHLRICIPFYASLFYPLKTIFPIHLSALYFFPDRLPLLLRVQLLLAPPVLVGILLFLWRFRTIDRTVTFGAALYLITLLPVLQIVSAGSAVVADRYSYIPSLGLCFLFGLAIARLKKRTASTPVKRLIPASLTAIIAISLAAATFNRCGVWKDGVTLWTDCLAKSANPVAFHNRGCAFAAEGRPDLAIADYTAAIALLPSYASAWYDRGSVYLLQGIPDKAIADLTEAARLNPRRADARNNRGVAYLEEKRYDEACADFNGAIDLKPGFADAYSNRGIALMEEKRYEEALGDFSRAVTIDPGSVKGYQGREECRKEMMGKIIKD
jgi:tetratricopeptide (TPR) repeat protein